MSPKKKLLSLSKNFIIAPESVLTTRHLMKSSVKLEAVHFELKFTFQYIYHNLHINNWTDVEVYPVGLADKPGLAVLYGVGTAASFIKDWSGVSSKMHMVPLSTLDILAAKRFSGRK